MVKFDVDVDCCFFGIFFNVLMFFNEMSYCLSMFYLTALSSISDRLSYRALVLLRKRKGRIFSSQLFFGCIRLAVIHLCFNEMPNQSCSMSNPRISSSFCTMFLRVSFIARTESHTDVPEKQKIGSMLLRKKRKVLCAGKSTKSADRQPLHSQHS